MKMKRLKEMKDTLIKEVHAQINNLECADYHELGAAIDMIKDLAETIYYCSIVKSMEDASEDEAELMQMVKYSSTKDTQHYEKDTREGRSGERRRAYMEAKRAHEDKAVHLKELESYAHELMNDVLEMIQEATIEERTTLKRKLLDLSNKI